MQTEKVQMAQKPAATQRSGAGMIMSVLVVLGLAGGGIWWFTTDADQHQRALATAEEWVATAQKTVTNLLAGGQEQTALPGVRGHVDADTKAPSSAALGEVTNPTVQPAVPDVSAVETLTPAGDDAGANPAAQTVLPVAGQSPALVAEAAQWLASCYKPAKQGGVLRLSVYSANVHYAGQLQAISLPNMAAAQGREAVLRLLFQAENLRTLYAQYGESFLTAFDAALQGQGGKALSPAEKKEAYRLHANYFASVSAALSGIAATPNLHSLLADLDAASDKATAINGQITESVFHIDMAREKKDTKAMEQGRKRVDSLTQQYRHAIAARDALAASIVHTLRKQGGRGLDDSTVLYLARWVNRRLAQDAHALATTAVAADIVQDIAMKMQQQQ